MIGCSVATVTTARKLTVESQREKYKKEQYVAISILLCFMYFHVFLSKVIAFFLQCSHCKQSYTKSKNLWKRENHESSVLLIAAHQFSLITVIIKELRTND